MEHFSDIVREIGDLAAKGGENPLAAILILVIIVGSLGYLLFKADNSYYRTLVFVAVTAMAAFIIYSNIDKTESTLPNVSPESTSNVDEATNVDVVNITEAQSRETNTYLPVQLPGNYWFGMTEDELSSALASYQKTRFSERLESVAGRAVNKEVKYIEVPVSSQGNFRVASVFGLYGDRLRYISAKYKCERQGYCAQMCAVNGGKVLENTYALDGTVPRWSADNLRTAQDSGYQYVYRRNSASTAQDDYISFAFKSELWRILDWQGRDYPFGSGSNCEGYSVIVDSFLIDS